MQWGGVGVCVCVCVRITLVGYSARAKKSIYVFILITGKSTKKERPVLLFYERANFRFTSCSTLTVVPGSGKC